MRVSNFLLWQIAYAEIWVTDTLWPDFRKRHLLEAILAYQKRDRRYGGINQPAVAGPMTSAFDEPRGCQSPVVQPSLMARVLSALVLLPIVVGAVWFLPPIATLVLSLIAAALAFVEYAAHRGRARRARAACHLAARPCLARAAPSAADSLPVDVVLMTAVDRHRRAGGRGQASPGRRVLRDAAAALFPVVYIGLPLGALAAVRADRRPRGHRCC